MLRLSREVEAKLLLVCALNEVRAWIESYEGAPEKLREFLLERLGRFDLNMDAVSLDIFHEAAKATCILDP